MAPTDILVQQVWEKGLSFAPETQNDWRKDVCYSFIKRNDFNNFDSEYGWGIEVIEPEKGNDIGNLRPMQWRNIKNPLIAGENEDKEKMETVEFHIEKLP